MSHTRPGLLTLAIFCLILGMGMDCHGGSSPTTPTEDAVDLRASLRVEPAAPLPNQPLTLTASVSANEFAASTGGTLAIYVRTPYAPNTFLLNDPNRLAFTRFTGTLTSTGVLTASLPAGEYWAVLFAEASRLGADSATARAAHLFVVSACGPSPVINGQAITALVAEPEAPSADYLLDLGQVTPLARPEFTLAVTGGVGPLTTSFIPGGGADVVQTSADGWRVNSQLTTPGRVNMGFAITDNCTPPRTFYARVTVLVVEATCDTPAPQWPSNVHAVGAVGVPFNLRLVALGQAPFTYAVQAGSRFPAGLTIDGDRVVGIPTTVESLESRLVATDSCETPRSTIGLFSFTIVAEGSCPPIKMGGWDGAVASLGVAYSHEINFSGGVAPYTVTLDDPGSIPPGLTFTDGLIAGTPTAPGSYAVKVRITDSCAAGSVSEVLTFPIEVGCNPLAITTTSLPNALRGQAYSQSISTSGGFGAVTLALVSGALPAGLSFSGTVIEGVATTVGTSSFAIQAIDTCSPPQVTEQTLTIMTTSSCPPLTFTSQVLPPGTRGVEYSQTVSATGGASPVTYALADGEVLPSGLFLNEATGRISGFPQDAGSFEFTLRATDACVPPQYLERFFSLAIAGACFAPIFDNPADLPAGTIGLPYSVALSATGGDPPYSFTLEPGSTLPAGLTMTSVGLISGTPTAATAGLFTVRVTDACTPGVPTLKNFGLSIGSGCPPPSITTRGIPGGRVGSPYSAQLSATGTSPFTYDLDLGSPALPNGLTLSSSGVLSGTPTLVYSQTITVDVHDSCVPSNSQFRDLDLNIVAAGSCPPVTLLTQPLSGEVGQVFNHQLQVSGGTPGYGFSHLTGDLPIGLIFAANGLIEGTPQNSGIFNIEVRVQDNCTATQSDTKTLTFDIEAAPCPPLDILTDFLSDGQEGDTYTDGIGVSGGVTPFQYEVTAGSLPAGLELNANTGAIEGTPTLAGNYGFTIRVTDSCSPPQQLSKPLSITIDPPSGCPNLELVSASPDTGTVGVPYDYPFTHTGGQGDITYSILEGDAPPGLFLDEATGHLLGTPTEAGTFGFEILIYDQCDPRQEVTDFVSMHVGS